MSGSKRQSCVGLGGEFARILTRVVRMFRENEPPGFRNWKNAPGHLHRVDGRMDEDGSPCEMCEVWQEAQRLADAEDEARGAKP